MRVTSVELHPSGSSEVAVLSFRDPSRQNPYNVKSIAGLDASIVPKFYGASKTSAVNLYTFSLDKRVIVIQITLNPSFSLGKSYSELRDDIYKMIASSRTGLTQVQFKNENGVVAAISGFITKLENPISDKSAEVHLTIEAVDPMLMALAPTNVAVAGLNPANTLITDDISTAPHGFDFVMNATAAFAALTISDPNDSSWSFTVTPSGGFLAGDQLNFSSVNDAKKLYIVRGANTIYLADVLTAGSVWPILFPGDNHLSFTNPASLTWQSISYYATYWGV